MTRKSLILIAALGSLAALLGAFGFQYIGGMPPCKLCLWQRWPHGMRWLWALIGMVWGWRGVPLLGALAAFSTAVIGGYHAGLNRNGGRGQPLAPRGRFRAFQRKTC